MDINTIVLISDIVLVSLIGACVGSFMACYAYRAPRNISIVRVTHSFCDNCKNKLGFLDLIPVVSYVLNMGKCRWCGKKYSPVSTYVEIMMAVFFPVIYFAMYDSTIKAGIIVTVVCTICTIVLMVADNLTKNKEKEEEELAKSNK